MLILWGLLGCGQPIDTGDDTGDTETGDPGRDYDGGAFLYGADILEFDLTLDDAALAALAAEPREDVHATFSFEGASWDVGLHLKGSENGSFRDMSGKASFKIDFHQWNYDADFHGVRRITLNNMVQDGTMSHEHAAYWLFAAMGVPSPRHGYAAVTVNGELFGLYGVVEATDEQLVDRLFPDDDDGNLYEGGYGADLEEHRDALFDVKEQKEAEPLASLSALIAEVVAVAPDGVAALLDDRFDREALLDLWAVELVAADTDGYATAGNNFLLYHAPLADRWNMIPWGPDQAFTETNFDIYAEESVWGGGIGRLAELCRADAVCSAALDERIAAVLTVWEAGPFVAYVDAETARIESACRADPRSAWGDYGCRDAQAAMREWIRMRPDQVRAQWAR